MSDPAPKLVKLSKKDLESDQDDDTIPYHADYTIIGTYQSLQNARAHCARYHGDLGAYGYDGAIDVLLRVDHDEYCSFHGLEHV